MGRSLFAILNGRFGPKVDAITRREAVFITVFRDRYAFYELHHEEGPARVGCAGVKHPGIVQVLGA